MCTGWLHTAGTQDKNTREEPREQSYSLFYELLRRFLGIQVVSYRITRESAAGRQRRRVMVSAKLGTVVLLPHAYDFDQRRRLELLLYYVFGIAFLQGMYARHWPFRCMSILCSIRIVM